jgi:hypothetical protein
MAEIKDPTPDLEAQNGGPSTPGMCCRILQHPTQIDETTALQGTGEKITAEIPVPPSTTIEGNERLPGGPIVPNDNHDTHHDAEDYDERAAKFWSVYVEEAESYDKAQVETWKDDMEGIIIFVRLPVSSLCLPCGLPCDSTPVRPGYIQPA